MEHGLEQRVKAVPAGGLLGFQLADFCRPVCELLLQSKEQRKTATRLLLCGGLDQSIVLATSEEATPRNMREGVKFPELAGPPCSNDVAMPAP